MKDRFGREINYMQISITDRCNYWCTCCIPEDGLESLKHSDTLSYDNVAIVAASAALGISKYRITGGKPLVGKGVLYLVKQLMAIGGVQDLGTTINGALIPSHARDLKKSGLDRVNIILTAGSKPVSTPTGKLI